MLRITRLDQRIYVSGPYRIGLRPAARGLRKSQRARTHPGSGYAPGTSGGDVRGFVRGEPEPGGRMFLHRDDVQQRSEPFEVIWVAGVQRQAVLDCCSRYLEVGHSSSGFTPDLFEEKSQ